MTKHPAVPARTVILTGGTSGLGYACARALARSDTPVSLILASRSQHAIQAINALKRATGNPSIEYLPLDLASLTSIRAFARDFAGLRVTVSSVHFWCPGSANATIMSRNAMNTCVERRKQRILETAKTFYIMPIWQKHILPSLTVEERRISKMSLQAPLPDKGGRVDRSDHPKYYLHENVSFDEDKWDLNYRSNERRESIIYRLSTFSKKLCKRVHRRWNSGGRTQQRMGKSFDGGAEKDLSRSCRAAWC